MTLPGAPALAAQVQAAVGQPSTVRIGTVVSVNPLLVDVQGTTFDNLGGVGFCPAVGDTVALLGQSASPGSDQASWLVLGRTGCYGEWIDYPVVWSTPSNPQPSIGNGTLRGRFQITGSIGHVWIFLAPGSTTTFGTGNWAFSLPFTTFSNTSYAAQCRDNSAPAGSRPAVAASFGAVAQLLRTFTTNGIVTATVPFTWAVDDFFNIQGSSEILV